MAKKPIKKAVKKAVKKAAPKKKAVATAPAIAPKQEITAPTLPEQKTEPIQGELVGEITHFFSGISVAVLKVTGNIKIGDKLKFTGATTNFEQVVDSMQINKQNIQEAKPGDDIGLKVKDRVREGDKVYKL